MSVFLAALFHHHVSSPGFPVHSCLQYQFKSKSGVPSVVTTTIATGDTPYTSVLPLPPRSLSSSTRLPPFASLFGSHNTKHPQQAPQAQQASPSASLHKAIPSDQPLDVPACTAPACRAAPWFPFAPITLAGSTGPALVVPARYSAAPSFKTLEPVLRQDRKAHTVNDYQIPIANLDVI
ncbi:hypothetical protein GGX14DRAFT_573487 [Mycena pura]|uniref:Uncharacterized protein n=1 Tax=Mycena pura TaxID=153505 RepID=A0AAD6V1C7_9AGAR|nr:hypothetical protein GGX14DRAFT_573487 [Mycena pura]